LTDAKTTLIVICLMSTHGGSCCHPSVLWHCRLGGRKGIWPVKNWVVGCWHGCLGWGADGL